MWCIRTKVLWYFVMTFKGLEHYWRKATQPRLTLFLYLSLVLSPALLPRTCSPTHLRTHTHHPHTMHMHIVSLTTSYCVCVCTLCIILYSWHVLILSCYCLSNTGVSTLIIRDSLFVWDAWIHSRKQCVLKTPERYVAVVPVHKDTIIQVCMYNIL